MSGQTGPGAHSDVEGPAAPIVSAIRRASAEIRLVRLSALREAFPAEAVCEGGLEKLLAESGAADIRRMAGERGEVYYFSAESMTEAYALHLFRVEEHDLIKLVAETVRDESRLYPRPTDLRVFSEPPFSLSLTQVNEIMARMATQPDTVDIKTCSASNGAVYLYSDRYLVPLYAERLAEWIEVGQKENP